MSTTITKQQTITLTRDKETKRTVRFVAPQGEDADITGSIYVSKDDPRSEVDSLKLTVKA